MTKHHIEPSIHLFYEVRTHLTSGTNNLLRSHADGDEYLVMIYSSLSEAV